MSSGPNEQRRLTAVEEAAGFAEHRAEQLEALVAELSSQVFDLSGRLERLEKRLGDLETGDTGEPDAIDTQPPPHAHRPL
jgi:uncharacterized coiled-coil protein SlyX